MSILYVDTYGSSAGIIQNIDKPELDLKDLLVEFRYNFIKFFVGKVEWYWRIFPAVASLLFTSVNFYIWRLDHKTINSSVINLYLCMSLIPQVILLVVTLSMRVAF